MIISTNTSISLIKDFDSKELYEWMLHSPTADVVIIVVQEKWPEKLTEKINEAFSKSYVLVWDWSMYTYSSFLFTEKLVGERLSQWILNLGIPGDKITIIDHYLISPKYWPVEIIEVGEEWPAVDFAIAEPYDANNVSIKFYKPTHEVIAFDVSSPRSIRSVVQGVAHFFIIVTEEPAEKWAHDLKDKLLKASTSNYVIIVDWSMYVFNSYMFTAAYSKRVADTVAA